VYDTITMDGINGQKQQVRILVVLFLLECSVLGFMISLFLDLPPKRHLQRHPFHMLSYKLVCPCVVATGKM